MCTSVSVFQFPNSIFLKEDWPSRSKVTRRAHASVPFRLGSHLPGAISVVNYIESSSPNDPCYLISRGASVAISLWWRHR